MNYNPHIQARNNRFISTCLNIIAHRKDIDMRTAVKLALATKPDCYYVSLEQARVAISHLNGLGRRSRPAASQEVNIAKWREISRRTACRRRAHPHEKYDVSLQYVINSMRPSRFFISEERAMRLMRPYITSTRLIKRK
jgi:hypothetical protein